jgi:hypothetical protein
MHARYSVSFDPNFCQGSAGFPPVSYHTWLPPRETKIYIIGFATPRE